MIPYSLVCICRRLNSSAAFIVRIDPLMKKTKFPLKSHAMSQDLIALVKRFLTLNYLRVKFFSNISSQLVLNSLSMST
jgi:hypothetical protein